MTDEGKSRGAIWLALLAGAIVLGTGPAVLAFLLLLGSDGASGLAQLVMEGGGASYAVLFAGALASLIGAVLAALSVRRPGLPASLALVPFVLPVLAALGGVIVGMRGVLDAVTHVAPADKATILAAATGELTSLCIQSLAFAAAGALAVAVAALVSLGAPGRGGRLLTVLGAGTLGLSLGSSAAQDMSMRSGFMALAHVSPADRLTLLMGVIEDWQRMNQVSNALFLLSLAVTVVGAAVLAARGQRGAGIGVAAGLLVAAVGFRGFNAMSERQLAGVRDAAPRAELMTVGGLAPLSFSTVALEDDEPVRIDNLVLLRARLNEPGQAWVGVELGLTLRPQTVLRALQAAHFVKAEVELVGQAQKKNLEAPPIFAAAVAAMSDVQLAAPVRVLYAEEPCEQCVLATLTPAGLKVGEVEWKQEEVPRSAEVQTFPLVEFAWSKNTGELVRAALIALSHQHILVVRVPLPDPPVVLPDY
ncbi:MAG: hypothetical protein Q8L48_31980 [Archangium sp.]|nr:hypothetical protein [Archangium sp.]